MADFSGPSTLHFTCNTPIKVFDKFNQDNPTLINPGDKVKFYKIDKQEHKNYNE